MNRRIVRSMASLMGIAAAAVFFAAGAQAADAPIAEVASVQGQVDAIDASGQARALHVGDPVYAGETVRTGVGGSVGLFHDEALAQLPESSEARVDLNAEGDPRLTLTSGAIRVVDPREQGRPIELVALDSSSTVLGGDREARILKEKAGAYAMLCDWVKPVAVKRRAEGKSAKPGDCVIGNRREPLFAAPGHDQRIPLLAGAPLLADAGPAIDPSQLIDPLPAVGAPGPMALAGVGPMSSLVGYPNAIRVPCATGQMACAGGNVPVVSHPPTDDGFPGGGGAGGGGFED